MKVEYVGIRVGKTRSKKQVIKHHDILFKAGPDGRHISEVPDELAKRMLKDDRFTKPKGPVEVPAEEAPAE